VANWAKAGFSPSVIQFKALFIDLKTLNRHLPHAIIEFKGFGFVGIAFRLVMFGISGAITSGCGVSLGRITPKFPAYGLRRHPHLLSDFFLTPTRVEESLNLIPLFETEPDVFFSYVL